MAADIYDLNCPFCGKVYKLPREKVVKHVGKTIFCRGCSQPFSVPPLPAFEPADVIEAGMFAAESAGHVPETRQRSASPSPHQESTDPFAVAETTPLPPPFSAEVLPSINDVLPTISEPPAVDLPHGERVGLEDGREISSGGDDSAIVYRKGREHGALAVEEAPSDLDSNGSAYGSTADLPLPLPDSPPDSPPELSRELPPDIGAESSAFEPLEIEPPDFEPAASNGIPSPGEPLQPRPKKTRAARSSVVPQLPQGIDLDSVPIARAAPPAPVINIDLKPLKRRLAWLMVMAVIIMLLLIANLLATLGYVPHRPI